MGAGHIWIGEERRPAQLPSSLWGTLVRTAEAFRLRLACTKPALQRHLRAGRPDVDKPGP